MKQPILYIDGYKTGHRPQYPEGTRFVQTNWTTRNSRIPSQDYAVVLGYQDFLQTVLMDDFSERFFGRNVDEVCAYYERRMAGYLGPANNVGTDHIRDLHSLGYLPLEFRALPEGTAVPLGVPMILVENTDPRFFWLPNYIETMMSAQLWLPITSATTASRFRKILEQAARETGSPMDFVDFQGHDFSMRGMQSIEAAARSGLGHLLYFLGTDTLPAIDLAEDSYGPVPDGYAIGMSVPATEHSVMCAGGQETELETFHRLLSIYPEGILSVVSDTWDLWNVCTYILPKLRDQIMARNGKLVIRPDSGDPVKIVCGDPEAAPGTPAHKGVVELLWDTFGGTETSTGHRVLDEHIGVIYGDGINEERMHGILSRLARKGFASANMVFGLGSFTYTYVTRDVYGMAMKATWCDIDGQGYDIFKRPITDDGNKNSAKGRLAVHEIDGKLTLIQQANPDEEAASLLQPVWRDGQFIRRETFDVIRARARAALTA